ncbi:hypothetical protein AHF37_08233 [Paragonimus kellicotti]|nr:hypothetical protein AHF37_08233 [Paragonimus kellicotti]
MGPRNPLGGVRGVCPSVLCGSCDRHINHLVVVAIVIVDFIVDHQQSKLFPPPPPVVSYNTSTNQLHTRVTRELCRALHNWINGTNADSATSTSDTEKSESRLVDSPDVNGTLELRKRDLLDKRGPNLGTAVHSMNTLYGILVTLDEFGPQSMRVLVFPVLPALCQRLTTLVEPSPASTDSHEDPLVNFTPPSRLSPADQRSFDSPESHDDESGPFADRLAYTAEFRYHLG